MALSPEDHRAVERVADLLDPSKRLLFVTGAGISADSGLPTYRGVGGLYADRPTPMGWRIEEVLSGDMMAIRPDLTWKYLAEIADASRGATFNRGHSVIAEMEAHFADVWTLTQNVDGFHRAAGSTQVIDIHGDMNRLICPKCRWSGDTRSFKIETLPPPCPRCAKPIRPDVVLFGEMLAKEKLAVLQEQMARGFDVVFSIGTSSLFPYIIEPVMLAHEAGVPTVEINPGETEIADLIEIKIAAGAAEALDAIWSRYRDGRGSD